MHGENAQKHNRDYRSRRLPGAWPWGPVGKWMTHKKERAAARRAEHAARREAEEAKTWFCESCGKMIEEGETGRHCRVCAAYWRDVSAGVFEWDRW